jgi:hypothetical protein
LDPAGAATPADSRCCCSALPEIRLRAAVRLIIGDSDRPIIGFRQSGLVSLEDGPARWSVWLILPPAAA